MPTTCIIWNCPNKKPYPGIHYFTLGHKKKRYDAWIKAIGRNLDEKLSPYNGICSRHFEDVDIVRSRTGAVHVRNGAIPKHFLGLRVAVDEPGSACDIPSAPLHGIPDPLMQETLDEAEINNTLSTSHNFCGSKEQIYIKTVHSYSITPELLKKELAKGKTKRHKEHEKRIKLATQCNLQKKKTKRLRKQVDSLKTIINDLKDKRLLSFDACQVLEKSFSGLPLSLMKRMLKKSRNISEINFICLYLLPES